MDTLLMIFSGNTWRFEPCKQVTSELLEVNKKLVYCGVEPLLMNVEKMPDFGQNHKKYVNVYVLKEYYPFVYKTPIDKTIIDLQRKNEVLLERGFYQILVDKLPADIEVKTVENGKESKKKQQQEIMPSFARYRLLSSVETQDLARIIILKSGVQILPCEISDIDFCFRDFCQSLINNEWNEFVASNTGNSSGHELRKLMVTSGFITVGFLAIRMNFLAELTKFWATCLSPILLETIKTFGWLGTAVNGLIIGGAIVLSVKLFRRKKK